MQQQVWALETEEENSQINASLLYEMQDQTGNAGPESDLHPDRWASDAGNLFSLRDNDVPHGRDRGSPGAAPARAS
jgi:hypothetical protein